MIIIPSYSLLTLISAPKNKYHFSCLFYYFERKRSQNGRLNGQQTTQAIVWTGADSLESFSIIENFIEGF